MPGTPWEALKSVGSNGETVFRLKGERAFEVDFWTFNRRCRLFDPTDFGASNFKRAPSAVLAPLADSLTDLIERFEEWSFPYGQGAQSRSSCRTRCTSMTTRHGNVWHALASGFFPAPTEGRCTSHNGRRHQNVRHRLARHVDSTNRLGGGTDRPPPHQDVASGPRGQIRRVEERRRREGEEREQVVRSQRNAEAVQIQRTGRREHRRHGMKLVGPGLSRGARKACRRQRLPGMEPGHLQGRRRARNQPEGARTRRRKQTGGPAMVETKPLTAYWMHDVIRISEPRTIRKARMAAGRGGAVRGYAGVGSRKTPTRIRGRMEAIAEAAGAPGMEVARPSIGPHKEAGSSSSRTIPGRECTVPVRRGLLPSPRGTHRVGTEHDRRRTRSMGP